MFTLAFIGILVALGLVSIWMAKRRSGLPSAEMTTTPHEDESWWPQNFPVADRQKFIGLIEQDFLERGEAVTLAGGMATMVGGGLHGLVNIAQACAQIDADEWKATIRGHFQSLAESKADQDDLRLIAGDWQEVKSLLTLRLWSVGDLPEDVTRWITREDIEGVQTLLAFDLPQTSISVQPQIADAWGVSREEAFTQALLNVRNTHAVEIANVELDAGFAVFMLHALHFYAASHALLLDDYPQCHGVEGMLVAIPHSHAMLCYPINSLEVLVALNSLIRIANGMYEEGPHSIVPDIYWYRERSFTRLPYRIDENGMTLQPPSAFMDMLGRLPEKT